MGGGARGWGEGGAGGWGGEAAGILHLTVCREQSHKDGVHETNR